MLSAFSQRLKTIPARTADWTGKAGPVAMLGCDYNVKGSGKALIDAVSSTHRDADYYAELVFHDKAPIEAPPDTVAFLPVMRCGNMTGDASGAEETYPKKNDWYGATMQGVADLAEKGYIPLTLGGDGSATLPAIEALKKVHRDEEIILVHFSASPCLTEPSAPIRVLQDKELLKGVISIGNRSVSAADRRVRKEKKVFYLDMHAIYSKGLFCVRDLRNDFPIYVSIDIGCLDPSAAPGSIFAESGGLSVRDLVHVLHGVRAPKILGMDIHGFDPNLDVYRRDGTGLTTLAAAKVAKECVLKAYSISTATQDEGLARVQMMQRQGSLSDAPYPEH